MQLTVRLQKLSAWWNSLPDELSLHGVPLRRRPSANWPLGVLPAFAYSLKIPLIAVRIAFWVVIIVATLMEWFIVPLLLLTLYLFFFFALKEESPSL